MYSFSQQSEERLNTCHEDLKRLCYTVIQYFDCTVMEGHRPQELQDHYYDTGRSKLKWPNGKHNKKPSLAVDLIPYPMSQDDWKNIPRFAMFAGVVKGVALHMGIPIRLGIDWDNNLNPLDNWIDAPHFELLRK